jgi:hypothetical protein
MLSTLMALKVKILMLQIIKNQLSRLNCEFGYHMATASLNGLAGSGS